MAPRQGISLVGNRCGALSTTRVSAKYWWSAPVGALLGLRMDSSCQDPTTWTLALLKEFAASHGLKRSGKKAEVLERWADFRNLIAEDVCRHRNEPILAWSNFFMLSQGASVSWFEKWTLRVNILDVLCDIDLHTANLPWFQKRKRRAIFWPSWPKHSSHPYFTLRFCILLVMFSSWTLSHWPCNILFPCIVAVIPVQFFYFAILFRSCKHDIRAEKQHHIHKVICFTQSGRKHAIDILCPFNDPKRTLAQ